MTAMENAAPPSSDAKVNFDHTDPEYIANPVPVMKDLRQRCPVAYSEKFDGFWVLSRYEDVRAATRDTETYSSAAGVTLPTFGSPVPLVPLESDPPLHTTFRKMLQREFRRGRMEELEPGIRQIANDLIDKFVDRKQANLASELAFPLPPIVIAQLMGFEEDDWARFQSLSAEMLDAAKAGHLEANYAAALEYCTYLMGALDARRAKPRDDMLTRIVEADIDGRPITEDEALGMTLITIVAGHETTVGGIGSLLYHVAKDPQLKQRLIDNPALIPKAVEEAVRTGTPVQGIARTLTKDVKVRDQVMKAGEKVWLMYCAANRDEDVFTDPDTFDADRSPNRHVGFGDGVHRCVGAPLAQTEMRIVMEEVLRRIPDFRVEDWDSVQVDGGQNRVITHLPAVWD